MRMITVKYGTLVMTGILIGVYHNELGKRVWHFRVNGILEFAYDHEVMKVWRIGG